MRKLVVVLAVLAVLAPAAAIAGGWATVKLSSTPAGSPGRRAMGRRPHMVLQHGVTPLANIEPHVRIVQGTVARQFLARPTAKTGVYRARVVFPKSGHVAVVDLARLQPHARVQARQGRARRPPEAPSRTGGRPRGDRRARLRGGCGREADAFRVSPPQAGIKRHESAQRIPASRAKLQRVGVQGARRGSGAPSSRSTASARGRSGTRDR